MHHITKAKLFRRSNIVIKHSEKAVQGLTLLQEKTQDKTNCIFFGLILEQKYRNLV